MKSLCKTNIKKWFCNNVNIMSYDYTVPDTLVLRIVERCEDTHKIDTTLFVIYDTQLNTYIIRGCRRRPKKNHLFSPAYSFECRYADHVMDFIKVVLDQSNDLNIEIYNYTDLPNDSNNITFEMLEKMVNREFEICAYDERTIEKDESFVYTTLNVLRHVNNTF